MKKEDKAVHTAKTLADRTFTASQAREIYNGLPGRNKVSMAAIIPILRMVADVESTTYGAHCMMYEIRGMLQ